MFRTSYVHHQEDCSYIVRTAYTVHVCCVIRAFLQADCEAEGCVRLHVQYSLPDDEHAMFETCRRQEEFKLNINL